MADKLETLSDLFELQLKDLYRAETQLLTALPLMAENARGGHRRAGFPKHLRETERQVQRPERIGLELGGHPCQAITGLVAKDRETMPEDATDEATDAALLAAAQRSEPCEIAGYGTAAHYAERLGHPEAADLLRQTLSEEQLADARLNGLDKSYLNQKAE